MCDVIKKRLKRRDVSRRKMKSPPKIGNPIFKIGSSTAVLIFGGWFLFPLIVTSLPYTHMSMTSNMPLSSASNKICEDLGSWVESGVARFFVSSQ